MTALAILGSSRTKSRPGTEPIPLPTICSRVERRAAEEEEMARAMKEVERLRLEMQRAQERVGGPLGEGDGMVVKRKKKPKKSTVDSEGAAVEEGVAKDKKKKKKKRREEGEGPATAETQPTIVDQ